MDKDRRALLASAIATAVIDPSRAMAQDSNANPETTWAKAPSFPIWPGIVPGGQSSAMPYSARMNDVGHHRSLLFLKGISVPQLHVFPAGRPDGRALLGIPGGGYGFVSVQNEGIDLARTFTPLGITVFVLTYRLPGEGWADRANVPLQDAQRALRLIRARGAEWGVAGSVGVIGFSAGGHVAATLATGFDERVYAPADAADRYSARPDFAGLIYPVVTMASATTHAGSRDTLLGPNPSAALVARRSAELHVTGATPPLFLLHALDDPAVPPENSLVMLAAARRAAVPVEAHLIEKGGHGFAFSLPATNPDNRWPLLFDDWTKMHRSSALGARV